MVAPGEVLEDARIVSYTAQLVKLKSYTAFFTGVLKLDPSGETRLEDACTTADGRRRDCDQALKSACGGPAPEVPFKLSSGQ